MPRKPVDYSNTVFYKIVCNDLNITDCYVGQTTNFTKRKYEHKNTCCNPNSKTHNSKIYQAIRDNGGWDNWTMVMIEQCHCNDVLEARKKEREHMEQLNATLNSNTPSRTKKEYWADWADGYRQYKEQNKEHIKTIKQQYYQNNRESIRAKSKQYTERHAQQNRVRLRRHEKTKIHLQYIAELEKKLNSK